MKTMIVILLSAMLTDNFVLSKFMGICPFLGVSKKLDSASGMGIAVTFVMICATLVTYPIHHGILVPNGLEYFDTVVFILVIALFVQLVENFLKKCVPSLYKSLGVYLPLITTNCAVLGVTVLNIDNEYSFFNSIIVQNLFIISRAQHMLHKVGQLFMPPRPVMIHIVTPEICPMRNIQCRQDTVKIG